MEIPLRAALLAWLTADPVLTAQLNGVTEETPARTALPWLAVAATASADWGAKEQVGREVRIALELHCRGDQPGAAAALVAAIEARSAALPPDQPGFRVVSTVFLRARAEMRAANTRAVLLEYRFRVLAA